MQIIPTLGPKVRQYYLHLSIWIPRVSLQKKLTSKVCLFVVLGFLGDENPGCDHKCRVEHAVDANRAMWPTAPAQGIGFRAELKDSLAVWRLVGNERMDPHYSPRSPQC